MAHDQTVFDTGNDDSDDLLANASAVVCFLKDVSPALVGERNYISDHGAHGLYLILMGLENTINQAASA